MNLKITAFVCGFVVMAFEIVGSRVLAPFMGASVFVWASIIGVILGAMSLGYAFGGRLADRQPKAEKLYQLVLLAAIALCLMNISKGVVLRWISATEIPLMVKSLTSATVLFALPSFFLAAVFPFVLKLALTRVEDAGKISGQYYAWSTLGSILGTISSAAWLLPTFGTTNIIWMLASALLLLKIVFSFRSSKSITALSVFLIAMNLVYANYPRAIVDIDSSYNRIWIMDGFSSEGRPIRQMALNGHVNSGMYVEGEYAEQLYPYTGAFLVFEHFEPNAKSVLMLGAGAYSFPKLFSSRYPQKKLDVVEIDPALTALSEQYFNYEPSANINSVHEDARTFLAHSDRSYDAILCDVFTSPLDVPWQMTTVEAYQQLADRMNDSAVLVVNVLGQSDGEHSAFMKSQVKTAQQVFAQVMVFEVRESEAKGWKNNMMVALKHSGAFSMSNTQPELQHILNQRTKVRITNDDLILRDDFAPAEWLLGE